MYYSVKLYKGNLFTCNANDFVEVKVKADSVRRAVKIAKKEARPYLGFFNWYSVNPIINN